MSASGFSLDCGARKFAHSLDVLLIKDKLQHKNILQDLVIKRVLQN